MTAPASRPRPARRALDELSLPVQRRDLDELALVAGWPQPEWLMSDREAAFDAWASLPGESNLLYTPYIDLRAAQLQSARQPVSVAWQHVPADLPDDASGLLVIAEGDVIASALSSVAMDAGVELTTFAELLDREPERAHALFDLFELPTNDKFAQLTRALWTQGVVLDVPPGVVLEKPIVIRWTVGDPDRALLTRSFIRVGDGAQASVVEELVGSSSAPLAAGADVGQAFLAGTTEAVLGSGASLKVASLQELPGARRRDPAPACHRRRGRVAPVGARTARRPARAQPGGQPPRRRSQLGRAGRDRVRRR